MCYYILLCTCLFCFSHQTHLDLQHGGVYLLTTDRESSDVTAPYLQLEIVSSVIEID